MAQPEDRILSRSDLRSPFEAGFKPPREFGVGLEYERFGVSAPPEPAGPAASPEWAPLPFEGPVSISAVFDDLVSRFGWQRKLEDGRSIELSRGDTRITLEPGLQMELSGRVHHGLAAAAAELRKYLTEVRTASEPLGIQWLAAGTHPTASLDGIPWLTKRRYEIMREYLPSRGRLAHHMMKGTCGAQVNLDFADEADAMSKLRTAMTLSSVVTAMFANSTITAGKPNGHLTERAAIWLETDPDRCGLLPFALEPSAGLDDYVNYALSVPMFFLVRNGRWAPLRGLTFGSFLERGHDGERATIDDWQLHLTTLFPEVRLKSYIEVRGSDSNAPDLVLAHIALWMGILYGGSEIMRAALAPMAGLAWQDHLRLRQDVPRLGLGAMVGGRPLLAIARELIAVAGSGLAASGAGEDRFLDPLRELVVLRGVTPAEDLLARLGAHPNPQPARMLDHFTRLDPIA